MLAMDLDSITPGPEALRALSHPVRLRMLGMLRLEGPATATTLAARLGLNTGATSYHLRQLAQHGFIEDDPDRGTGRERWWRSVHQSTQSRRTEARTEEEQDTQEAYLQAVGILYASQLQRAIEQERGLPEEWRQAGTFSDWGLRLTAESARALRDAIGELIFGWEEAPEGEPGARVFEVNLNAFLHPDDVAAVAGAGGAGGAGGDERP